MCYFYADIVAVLYWLSSVVAINIESFDCTYMLIIEVATFSFAKS